MQPRGFPLSSPLVVIYTDNMSVFPRIEVPENLHDRVTRVLALQVLEAEKDSRLLVFPNETNLCQQLGVSRTVLREAVKVLTDKGMVEVRQRLGTRATPRSAWNQLDPDILGWWAELGPDAGFLRDLCEVRLAIEPTASGFAAVRATPAEVENIQHCLEERETKVKSSNFAEAVDLNLEFHSAVVRACHNSLLEQLNQAIRQPLRTALSYTAGIHASDVLDVGAHRRLVEAIHRHDAMKARAAAERIVGLAMLGVEEAIRAEEKSAKRNGNRLPPKSLSGRHSSPQGTTAIEFAHACAATCCCVNRMSSCRQIKAEINQAHSPPPSYGITKVDGVGRV